MRIVLERLGELSTDHGSIPIVYANSLLVDLNARPVVEGRGTDDAHETIPTFVMQVPGSIPEGASRAVGKVRVSPVPPPYD